MHMPDYSLTPANARTIQLARRWLVLGVAALGLAGVFAGFLANTKQDFFYTALVVHVDLSVLVWFLSQACMLFTLLGDGERFGVLRGASFISFALGTALIALSAAFDAPAYMSNYIPVIHHPVFFLGLSLILCGTVIESALALWTSPRALMSEPQRCGIVTAAVILLVAVACFVRSRQAMPEDLAGQVYYEYAFWGGGHVLQFVHTQLMIVCWLWLASASRLRTGLKPCTARALYVVGLMAAFPAIAIYWLYPPMSDEHRSAFTLLMRHANGLTALVAAVFILPSYCYSGTSKEAGVRLPRAALFMSILLFGIGGGLGYLIDGSNVTVPAHYHGSIVGVTLAFMGVAYMLLPTLGFRDLSRSWLAFAQPVIYGVGQLCWMTGMALLGAADVPRKTPGSAEFSGHFASFLKHGGDGIALIGGLLFVFNVAYAIYRRPRRA